MCKSFFSSDWGFFGSFTSKLCLNRSPENIFQIALETRKLQTIEILGIGGFCAGSATFFFGNI